MGVEFDAFSKKNTFVFGNKHKLALAISLRMIQQLKSHFRNPREVENT